jgi:hypothetical protein
MKCSLRARWTSDEPLTRFALATLLVGFCTMPAAAHAQDYPVKPIRMIVGVPPGGTTDIMGRIVAAKLTERLGRQVVVDNRTGASGIIAIQLVAARSRGFRIRVGEHRSDREWPHTPDRRCGRWRRDIMDAESRALGVAPEERRKRMYEHIRVLKHLWYNDRAEFKGSFHSFADLVLEPKPVNPNCPIWTATNATRLASGATNAASSGSDYALKQCGRLGGRVDDAQCLTARHIRLVGPDTGGG